MIPSFYHHAISPWTIIEISSSYHHSITSISYIYITYITIISSSQLHHDLYHHDKKMTYIIITSISYIIYHISYIIITSFISPWLTTMPRHQGALRQLPHAGLGRGGGQPWDADPRPAGRPDGPHGRFPWGHGGVAPTKMDIMGVSKTNGLYRKIPLKWIEWMILKGKSHENMIQTLDEIEIFGWCIR